MYRLRTFVMAVAVACFAGEVHAGNAAGANSKLADGEAGATVGTLIYNMLFAKKKPLPVSSGDVVQKTVQNLGAQKSLKESWIDAVQSASGLKPEAKPAAPAKPNAPSSGGAKTAPAPSPTASPKAGPRASTGGGAVRTAGGGGGVRSSGGGGRGGVRSSGGGGGAHSKVRNTMLH